MRVQTKTTTAPFHFWFSSESKRIIKSRQTRVCEEKSDCGLQILPAVNCNKMFWRKKNILTRLCEGLTHNSCTQSIWCSLLVLAPLIPLTEMHNPQEQPQNLDSSQWQREAKVSQLPPFQQIPKFQKLQRGLDNTSNKTSTAGVKPTPPPHPPPRLLHCSLKWTTSLGWFQYVGVGVGGCKGRWKKLRIACVGQGWSEFRLPGSLLLLIYLHNIKTVPYKCRKCHTKMNKTIKEENSWSF